MMLYRIAAVVLLTLSLSGCSTLGTMALSSLSGGAENSGVAVDTGDIGYNKKDYVVGTKHTTQNDNWTGDNASIQQGNTAQHVTASNLLVDRETDTGSVIIYKLMDFLMAFLAGFGIGRWTAIKAWLQRGIDLQRVRKD